MPPVHDTAPPWSHHHRDTTIARHICHLLRPWTAMPTTLWSTVQDMRPAIALSVCRSSCSHPTPNPTCSRNIKTQEYSHSTSMCFVISLSCAIAVWETNPFLYSLFYAPCPTRRIECVFQVFRGVDFLCSEWRFDPLRWNLFWASPNLFRTYSRIQMEYRKSPDSGWLHTRRFLHSREEKLQDAEKKMLELLVSPAYKVGWYGKENASIHRYRFLFSPYDGNALSSYMNGGKQKQTHLSLCNKYTEGGRLCWYWVLACRGQF